MIVARLHATLSVSPLSTLISRYGNIVNAGQHRFLASLTSEIPAPAQVQTTQCYHRHRDTRTPGHQHQGQHQDTRTPAPGTAPGHQDTSTRDTITNDLSFLGS